MSLDSVYQLDKNGGSDATICDKEEGVEMRNDPKTLDEAKEIIVQIESELSVVKARLAFVNNIARHTFSKAVEEATDTLFKELSWRSMTGEK